MFSQPVSHRAGQRGYPLVVMLSIIAAVGIFSIFWGERVQANGGFGHDGTIYGTIAQLMNVRTLDTYYFQRIFPSVLVHIALTALRQPLDHQHVILAFSLLNLGQLLLSCVFYRWIAEELDLHQSGLWFGFVGIFVNFAYFKYAWYYPVLTDVTATSLSLAMLLFYLRRQQLPLVIVTLLGAFTWPTLIYIGIFLLVFPREPIVAQKTSLPKWLAGAGAAFVFAKGVRFYYTYCVLHHSWRPALAQPICVAIPLSLILCSLYVYGAFVVLLRGISARTFLASLTLGRVALAAALFVATNVPAYLWADRTDRPASTYSNITFMVELSVVKPLSFLVAHTIYFGPAFLLFLFYWKPFSQIIRSYGVGLTLVIWMGVFLSINTESRQNLSSYVIAVPFLGLLIEKLALPARFIWLIGALALAFSLVWVRIGSPVYDDGRHLHSLLQNYFFNQGPWVNNLLYAVQGGIVLATAALLYAYLRSTRRRTV
jgi:hypothetical protein